MGKVIGWAGLALLGSAVVPAGAASITVTSNQQLLFGRFVAGTGGSIAVNPSGARSAAGGVILISSATVSAAQFTVSGDANLAYSVSLPANGTVSLTKAGGQSMSLSDFTSNPTGTGQLSGVGKQFVTIGATLNIGSQQAPGSYTGTFDLFVDYN